MYQWSCLGILICGSSPRSVSQHSYLWILHKIDTGCVLRPCAEKTLRSRSSLMFCAGETHILTCRDAFFVALRRPNANFDFRRRVLCGPAQGKQSDRDPNFDVPRRIFCGPAQAKRKFDLPRRVLCPYHADSRGVTTR